MNKIPFHGAVLAILCAGALCGQPNPAAGPAGNYPSSPGAGGGAIDITLVDRIEIMSIGDRSMRLTMDLELKGQRKVEVSSIVWQDLRIDGVLISPRISIDTFTVDTKSTRKLLNLEAPVSPEMYRWVKENRFGSRVPVEGTALFNGRESGMFGGKLITNQPAPLRGQSPVLVRPGESVLADLKSAACMDRPGLCDGAVSAGGVGGGPAPAAPTNNWQTKIKEMAQGRLVVLQATYSVDAGGARNTVSVYRQGFRLPNGQIVGPTDLLDASKIASAPISTGGGAQGGGAQGGGNGAPAGGIESAIRDVLDRIVNGMSDKPVNPGAPPPPPGAATDLRVVAWVPTPAGSDRISIGAGTGYPVVLKKRLATTDAGAGRTELGVYDFQGDWPPMPSGDVAALSPLAGFGECIQVRLDGIPQAPTSGTANAQAVSSYVDLPQIRPMGVMAGMGMRNAAAYFGSVVMNREGRFVALLNSEDTAVVASEIERAMIAPGAPDPRPEIKNRDGNRDGAGPNPGPDSGPTFELKIETTPAGASVTVDGQLQFDGGKPAVTPTVLRLPKKTYSITLSKQGYASLTRDVTVEDDEVWRPTLKR